MDNQNIRGADDLVRRLQKAEQYIKDDVKMVIGVEAVKHFKQCFILEGFTDAGLSKWAPRRAKVAGANKPTLTKSGELADSIDFRIEGDTVVIYSDKEYAQIHNEGGTITVTAAMRSYFWAMHYQAKEAGDEALANSWKWHALAKEIKIPKRQYIGESRELLENIENKMIRDLTNILKG